MPSDNVVKATHIDPDELADVREESDLKALLKGITSDPPADFGPAAGNEVR